MANQASLIDSIRPMNHKLCPRSYLTPAKESFIQKHSSFQTVCPAYISWGPSLVLQNWAFLQYDMGIWQIWYNGIVKGKKHFLWEVVGGWGLLSGTGYKNAFFEWLKKTISLYACLVGDQVKVKKPSESESEKRNWKANVKKRY